MSGKELPSEKSTRQVWADLGPRLISAMVLLPVTAILLFLGGPLFALLVGGVFALTYHEWEMMTGNRRVGGFGLLRIGLIAIVAVAYAAGGIWVAAVMLAFSVFGALIFGGRRRWWRSLGMLFIGTVVIAVLSMRGDTGSGVVAGVFLGTAVWMTDSGAFFTGRLFGGAKLFPEISPSKTWSGALGGLLIGTLASLLVWVVATPSPWWIGAILGATLSLSGQVGDLFESAVKRFFRIKDSGDIIPGHGGLMDRLDSLTFAVLVLVAIGAMHGGLDRVAEGFLYW